MARPYVICIASEKGGVGKTTLATNLAIYLKGLAEDLPITLFSFDNHFTVDQMFQLGKTPHDKHIGQLFSGSAPHELLIPGQYGVQIIPSSRQLFDIQHQLQGVDTLARILCRSKLGGLVIIDTSPILDIYTRNALFAADRIIVPIKDAASLENCQNLAGFLKQQQRPKSTLRILPCLIDTRIHFDGPFRNSYQLLKAYAINRGYRCYEGFISKSPKVESLSTNPSGKIYPVITHGRKTDVHLQFKHLTRQVYLDYLEQGSNRINEIANQIHDHEARLDREQRERLSRLQPHCLCCNKPWQESIVPPGAFYLESADGQLAGFAEESCFIDLILQECYGEAKRKNNTESLRELLMETTEQSYLLLQWTPLETEQIKIDLYRLDQQGEILTERSIVRKERGLFNRQLNSKTTQLLDKPTKGKAANPAQLLLAHRMTEHPLQILEHRAYLEWQTVFSRVQVDLAVGN